MGAERTTHAGTATHVTRTTHAGSATHTTGTTGTTREQLTARLRATGVVPVVELPSVASAVPLVEALVAGGIDCVEITFRTPAAADGLAAVRSRFPDVLLAAGTVLAVEQVEQAVTSGADLIVSPGVGSAVIEACLDAGLPVMPGISTPTEIELARAYGLRALKFFPAGPLGGVPYLKALCAVYRELAFIPTGGIGPDTLGSYLALPQVIACGGSWLVKPALYADGDFDTVTRLAREASAIVAQVRGAAPPAVKRAAASGPTVG